MKPIRKLDYIPEILYEQANFAGEKTSPIPFMEIPKDKDMPVGLFILEYRHTGEYEVGEKGKPEEIMDGPYPHMFVEFDYVMEVIKEYCPEVDHELVKKNIRTGLGLKPTQEESRRAGEKILEKVESKTDKLKKQAEIEAQKKREDIKKQVKDLMDKKGKSN